MHLMSIEVVETVGEGTAQEPIFMINGRAYLDIQSALNAVEDELIEGRDFFNKPLKTQGTVSAHLGGIR